ncbi:MAG: hypothetical protein JO266_20610 [Acidobacteria bacterium]|nr:hypothetical protein [Acidobacteriota bacterium]
MTITKHAALLLTTLVVLTGLLNAQTSRTIKTQVPFEFVANGESMPAGECTIAVAVNGRTLLSISSGERHAYVLPISDASPNARKKTALVFHQYGDQYFLAGIKRENGSGYQLPASTVERELQARNVTWQVFTLLASAK